MSPLHYYYSIIQGFVYRYFGGLCSFFEGSNGAEKSRGCRRVADGLQTLKMGGNSFSDKEIIIGRLQSCRRILYCCLKTVAFYLNIAVYLNGFYVFMLMLYFNVFRLQPFPDKVLYYKLLRGCRRFECRLQPVL